tara:strand:+ start:2157 stop:2690 length:534 start_codon:yes stop_codon:yes gene_type:complete
MSVFKQALTGAFTSLPPALQKFHAGAPERRYTGHATIEHGRSVAAQVGVKLGRFPPPGHNIPFAIAVSQTGQGEHWVRDFDGHVTESSLRYDQVHGQIIEKLGHVICALSLRCDADQLHVDVARFWLFGLPLPSLLMPRSISREWQDGTGAFCFDIGAQLPGGASLIRYYGRLVPQL